MVDTLKGGNGPGSVQGLPRGGRPERQPVFTPRADVFETAEELLIEMDLPGVKADNLEVHFEGGELLIRGSCPPAQAPARSWLAVEYQPGDYERAFRVSPDLDASKISAELKNGVLTLRLPKAEASKARKINVRSE